MVTKTLGASAPQPTERIRVGVLTGGASAERDISLATGAQIAASLFVSENTVKTHVRRIFDKLGVQGRTEVAVWATHQGLALSAQSQ